MLIGRDSELQQLNRYYGREGSQIVVVYGQRNIGKTALIREFILGKPSDFYMARSCSEREQRYQWARQLEEAGYTISDYPAYKEIFSLLAEGEEKKVLVVEEFQNLIKADSTFMQELADFIRLHGQTQRLLVILSSSTVGWVEKHMVEKIGETAYALSGLLKLKELKFKDCMEFFPEYDKKQCMEVYALFGGFPGLWEHFNDKASLQENIVSNILSSTGPLFYEAERIVAEELREMAVYNTILAAIAEGRHKLNDLYLHTGFSRAKISVYLKNLMELEIVEKVFSYDTEGYTNVQKGIYRISNHLVHFYYRFLYPNQSRLASGTPGSFYLSVIGPKFSAYVAEYFKDICMEYLIEKNERRQLPFVFDRFGEWVGKSGNIDIIVQDEMTNTILALCNYEKPAMTYEDYRRLLSCAQKARLGTEYIFLFSAGRFDEKLSLEAKIRQNLTLVSLKEL